MTDQDFLLADLAEHGPQSSWDWDADLRFARHAELNEQAEQLEVMIRNGSMQAIHLHDTTIKPVVTSRRLRVLRQLVKQGAVHASWAGVGPGMGSLLGVNRTRMYALTAAGR